jgi:hypothetical protein
MVVFLKPGLFVNNKYAVRGRNREALFTVVDEEFAGHNRLGRINVITVAVRDIDGMGNARDAYICTPVIGLGDGVIGVRSDNPLLRGKRLNKDNMEECLIEVADG